MKSTKSLMVRTMGAQTWSLEEFSTILCRIEAALNSRPLVPITCDPEDLDCLTPGHTATSLKARPTNLLDLLAQMVFRIFKYIAS